MKFSCQLVVTPRRGVRDPQGEAVQQALSSAGFAGLQVHCVGRTLHLDITASSEVEARKAIDDMCRRLLVNPNLETYTLTLAESMS